MAKTDPKYGGTTISASYPPKSKFSFSDGTNAQPSPKEHIEYASEIKNHATEIKGQDSFDYELESTPLQQSTTQQRQTTTERIEDFNTRVNTQPEDRGQTNEEKLAAIREKANEVKGKVDNLANEEEGQENVSDGFNESGEQDALTLAINEVNANADAELDSFDRATAKIQNQLDSTYADLVRSTKAVYGDRIREMKEANKRLYQTKRTVGIRQGRERYTSVLQDGILQDEEIKGIQRVQEISNEMALVLAQAADAKAKNDLKAFNDNYDRIEQIRESAKKEIASLYEAANEKLLNDQKARNEKVKAEKEAFNLQIEKSDQVAPAIAARITDLGTPEEQAQFIELMAANVGVDSAVLLGSVYDSIEDNRKRDVDIKNIESQIGVRWSSENRQEEKWTDEQAQREDRVILRQALVEALETGDITIEEARTEWGKAFPIKEFDEEFNSWIDEL